MRFYLIIDGSSNFILNHNLLQVPSANQNHFQLQHFAAFGLFPLIQPMPSPFHAKLLCHAMALLHATCRLHASLFRVAFFLLVEIVLTWFDIE